VVEEAPPTKETPVETETKDSDLELADTVRPPTDKAEQLITVAAAEPEAVAAVGIQVELPIIGQAEEEAEEERAVLPAIRCSEVLAAAAAPITVAVAVAVIQEEEEELTLSAVVEVDPSIPESTRTTPQG
tara:strand:- start:821 stop:1210 length:390 start_codon:yes stop_codon:yes gene_type:complete